MRVRAISVTKPLIPECTAPGELIAYVGRVSNPANQANTLTAPRLLAYLVKKKHWSPFQMVDLTIEIVTTRDIARQILRHRSFEFQEFSQRYAAVTAPPVFREARMQDAGNRQSSIDTDDQALHAWWKRSQRAVSDVASAAYEAALANGIAKEVARAVLPEGLTESVIYMKGSIRSWIHYIALRTEAGTQKEHRDVAAACAEILFQQIQEISPALIAEAMSG